MKEVWLKKVDVYLWSVCYGTRESWERSSPMCKKDALELLNLYRERIIKPAYEPCVLVRKPLKEINEALPRAIASKNLRNNIKNKGRKSLSIKEKAYAISEKIIVYSNDLQNNNR